VAETLPDRPPKPERKGQRSSQEEPENYEASYETFKLNQNNPDQLKLDENSFRIFGAERIIKAT
jgi:hypothetical protein